MRWATKQIQARSICGRCGAHRTTKVITGGGLPEKGMELCRPCTQGAKLAHQMREAFAKGAKK